MSDRFPVWQIPIKDASDRTETDQRLKYHCFYRGLSMCGRYRKNTNDDYDEIEIGEILSSPELVCQECFREWLKRFW